VSSIAEPHPADANLDGTTNVLDFNIWNANKFSDQETDWSTDDFNGDGKTNVLDFNVWNEHKFTSATARLAGGQVPEPATLILLSIALTFAAAYCRRRRRSA
jgi:hypothetical protein